MTPSKNSQRMTIQWSDRKNWSILKAALEAVWKLKVERKGIAKAHEVLVPRSTLCSVSKWLDDKDITNQNVFPRGCSGLLS
eukprot:15357266-Ditylum_brightwellii.AAC.1